ncbi:MAG: DUF2721 domain-containing protein [Myxococcota bacterium]
MISWATPLLVLPGVGLLVMSTSARFARLHDELHHHMHVLNCSPETLERLLLRGRLFRNTLLALYGAAALLATSGLAGGLSLPEALSSALLGLGVSLMVVASLTLMRETTISLDIIEAEVRSTPFPEPGSAAHNH